MATLIDARLSQEERSAIEAAVCALAERLGDDLHSVWLYGSRARGEDTGPESDIDLLVVTTGGRRRDFHLVNELIARAAEDNGVDSPMIGAVVWDPDRLADRREIKSFFVQEVDRDKIVLYGDP